MPNTSLTKPKNFGENRTKAMISEPDLLTSVNFPYSLANFLGQETVK